MSTPRHKYGYVDESVFDNYLTELIARHDMPEMRWAEILFMQCDHRKNVCHTEKVLSTTVIFTEA